jgi:hypothetical protein
MSASPLNLSALVEFNKYTLAIAAAGLVYTIQTFVPAEGAATRWLVLGLLGVFLASLVCGALLFAACTRAMHGSSSPAPAPGSGASTPADPPALIEFLGTAHAGLLVVGLIALCALFVPRVLAKPTPPTPLVIRCAEPTASAPIVRAP